eukprot:scpid108729/ scgid21155/ 
MLSSSELYTTKYCKGKHIHTQLLLHTKLTRLACPVKLGATRRQWHVTSTNCARIFAQELYLNFLLANGHRTTNQFTSKCFLSLVQRQPFPCKAHGPCVAKVSRDVHQTLTLLNIGVRMWKVGARMSDFNSQVSNTSRKRCFGKLKAKKEPI